MLINGPETIADLYKRNKALDT